MYFLKGKNFPALIKSLQHKNFCTCGENFKRTVHYSTCTVFIQPIQDIV